MLRRIFGGRRGSNVLVPWGKEGLYMGKGEYEGGKCTKIGGGDNGRGVIGVGDVVQYEVR